MIQNLFPNNNLVNPHFVWLALCIIIMSSPSITRTPIIELSPSNYYIILYTNSTRLSDSQEKVYFKADFSSTQFIVDKKFQNQCLYLDNHKKTRTQSKCLTNNARVRYETVANKFSSSHGQDSEDLDQQIRVDGVIGFKNSSEFSKSVKASLGWNQVRFWFKLYENKIELLEGKCRNPQFPPYQISIRGLASRHTFKIPHLSLSFHPHVSSFVKVFNHTANPFTLTRDQLSAELQVQLFNQVESLPMKTLLDHKCLKVAGSQNQECDLEKTQQMKIIIDGRQWKQEKDDIGLLLVEYQPILCSDVDALEFPEQNKVGSQFYYWGHILLIAFQFTVLIIFNNRQIWRQKFENLLRGNSRYERYH